MSKHKEPLPAREPRRESVPLGELIEDWSLYPRHQVDPTHVADLARALRASQPLPPPIVDAASKRIVDGIHRARAWRRVLGATGAVLVELRHYDSEQDMLLDAIRLNAVHGRRLGKDDRVRCVALAEERHIAPERIAVALCVEAEVIPTLRVRIASAPEQDLPGTISGTAKVALKGSVLHLEGRQLTPEQVRGTMSAPGTSYTLLAQQLCEALECGLCNLGSARFWALMDRLHETWADVRQREQRPPTDKREAS